MCRSSIRLFISAPTTARSITSEPPSNIRKTPLTGSESWNCSDKITNDVNRMSPPGYVKLPAVMSDSPCAIGSNPVYRCPRGTVIKVVKAAPNIYPTYTRPTKNWTTKTLRMFSCYSFTSFALFSWHFQLLSAANPSNCFSYHCTSLSYMCVEYT
jgi:hypothetical protein